MVDRCCFHSCDDHRSLNERPASLERYADNRQSPFRGCIIHRCERRLGSTRRFRIPRANDDTSREPYPLSTTSGLALVPRKFPSADSNRAGTEESERSG